jgi:hypothetical protein
MLGLVAGTAAVGVLGYYIYTRRKSLYGKHTSHHQDKHKHKHKSKHHKDRELDSASDGQKSRRRR